MDTLNEYKFAKSVCLNCQDEMLTLNKYLFENFGIAYFGYIKCFPDGTHICLTTDNKWAEFFYKNFFSHGVFHKNFDSYVSGIMLWSFANDQTSFNAFREHSGVDHGITLIEKTPYACEFFTFGGEPNKPQIINFYLNNLDVLWRHAYFFKDKGEALIKKARGDRFILPKLVVAKPTDKIITDDLYIKKKLVDAPIHRYLITVEGTETYLTESEAKCCYHLTQGKAIKEVAKVIGLSPKTVEHHLAHVKQKLNCATKSELINKILRHTNLAHIFMA